MKTSIALLAALLASPATGQFTDGHIFVTDYSTNQVFEIDPTDWSWQVFAGPGDGISGPSGLGFTTPTLRTHAQLLGEGAPGTDVAPGEVHRQRFDCRFDCSRRLCRGRAGGCRCWNGCHGALYTGPHRCDSGRD